MKRFGSLFQMMALSATVGLAASLGGCSTAKKVKRTLDLNELHIQAAIAEDEGDWRKAYDLWNEYVEQRPQSALAEFRLGQAEMQLGYVRDAVSHMRIAHDLQPGNIEYIEGLAEALVAAGDTEALMTLLRQTAEEGPDGSGYIRMGRYAQEAGLYDEAREAFELAIVNERGESVEPYLEMASFYRAIGDTDQEVHYLRMALWFDRTDANIKARLTELGMIPGPSLAIQPEF